MPEERGLGDGALGRNARTGGDVSNVNASVGMRLDRSVARLWMSTYDDLTRRVRTLRQEIRSLNTEASRTTSAISGMGGGAPSSASTTTASATSNATATTARLVQGTGGGSGGGLGGGAGATGGAGGGLSGAAMASGNPYAMAASMAAKKITGQMDKFQEAMRKVDARIDRGYGPALEADRQSVMFQQMYGISQQQNYNQFRKPINNYRLGPGGINQMLTLQAGTGLNAQIMAPGVEAIRTMTGFGLSTGDVSNMLSTLASPEVNNRLTMTLGTGLYGPGGKQRSPVEVIQAIVRGAGLTNENVVKGALQPGSMTRARLTAMGVPPEMQDVVIQYAMQNIQYQKKTGGTKGMYNPSDRKQLGVMGIDKNFATEREVSDVRRTQRDESFYNKQKDNYASLERNTQKMEDLTRALEETTAALIGARISTRNNPLTNALGKGFGAAFGPIKDALGLVGGDPVERGRGSMSPKSGGNGNGGGAPFIPSGLHKTFGDRLRQMMSERPSISIGTGFRSSGDQRTMFLSRYSKTSEKTGVYWDGSYWKKHAGVPHAAPPGMSMHELGLAVDLKYPTKADEEWFMRNASRFGLKTISSIDEPWHVQPAELPNSRRQYESQGAIWGKGPAGTTPYPFDATFEGGIDSMYSDNGTLTVNSQMSIADSIAYSRASNLMRLGGGGVGGRVVTLRTGLFKSDKASGKPGTAGSRPSSKDIPAGFKYRTTPNYGGWGYFVPQSFSDADLEQLHLHEQKDWTRIVKNSDGTLMGGFAMNQYNWNRGGGLAYAKNPALATPEEQKKVAKVLLEEFHAHDGFESIVRGNITWPNVGKLKALDLPPGTPRSTTYGPAPSGDPIGAPSRGSGTVIVNGGGGGGVTIAPNIYIQSTGNNVADAQRAAQEIADIISRKVKTTVLRGM
jgi:hypothetical protein